MRSIVTDIASAAAELAPTTMCSGRMPSPIALAHRGIRLRAAASAWSDDSGAAASSFTPMRASLTVATRTAEEIHLRRADEAGDEAIGRMVVELERRADLLDAPAAQHDDPVGHGHRLDLVVGDVDHGRAQPVVQRR